MFFLAVPPISGEVKTDKDDWEIDGLKMRNFLPFDWTKQDLRLKRKERLGVFPV